MNLVVKDQKIKFSVLCTWQWFWKWTCWV